MLGLFSKYLFAVLWTFLAFLVIRRKLIQKEKEKPASVLLVIYSFVVVMIIYGCIIDLREYNSFNNLKTNQIIGLRIGEKWTAKNNLDNIFKELKDDEFTWVNHPNVTQRDTITVFTKERKYLFLIKNTSNQGVLVSRINQMGSDYVINRNDNLLAFME